MAIPKLKLISKDDGLVKELEKFIYQKSEEQFNILVKSIEKGFIQIKLGVLRRFLWNKNFMMR